MARKETHFDFSCIDSRPKKEKEQIPLWCDYLEMLCLMEYRGFLSKGEVIDAVFNEGKGMVPPADESDDSEEDDEDEDSSPSPSAGLAAQLATMGSQSSQRSDRHERLAVDWFNHLATRGESLGDLYPFEADGARSTLKLKALLTPAHKLYFCLLLASNLHLFSANLRTKLTADFEHICLEAQKLLFPLTLDGARVQTHLFGKNPSGAGLFTGTLAQKLENLGALIQARQVDTSFISPSNSGDGGIDLVSVMNFDNDNAFGLPLILSQCACSYKDWKKKQHDHDAGRYRQMRLFDVDYLRLVFIPFFYRDQKGQWFDIAEVQLSVIDRLRLMKILLNQRQELYKRANSWADLILFNDRQDRQLFANFMAEEQAA